MTTNIFTDQHAMRMRTEKLKYRDRNRINANCIIIVFMIAFVVFFYYTVHHLIRIADYSPDGDGHSLESLLMEGLPPHKTAGPTSAPTQIVRTFLRKIERHISQPHASKKGK